MIGVFDSGVGGLTVIKEIFKELPGYQIIYFGDTARLPYGTKGADFVKKYSLKISQWLLQRGAKVIVIACHTSSAWASESLKKQFAGIPIFEMINPGVKEAVKITKNKKIGIIGTPGTIKSGAWEKKLLELEPNLKIYSKSCPLFVPLVEEGWINKEITREIIEEYLEEFKNRGVDTLVLACTHYPILEKIIKKEIGPKIKIVNPARSLVKELKLFLKNNPKIVSQVKKGRNHQFFFSDQPYNLEKISHFCLNKKIKPIIKDPF
ncbi:MAG: glutamate racemase [Candidatus Nealsonbacteria bacterium CG10_big_fil_rev_8_21_14_0_10_36_24]|uniref:Glutamate racemase n=2 Tax=Candidatus Nealsoniibacteriota TaxID=1817911 RepID=A0A2H0YPE8_9BACT|nr:MAG: glutamate racemase [Candidatus Nealsonbacteria bacterium CG10_big_fil_rev_8_21_14_0_10_36_24]PIS40296.1 MAG: glutamate racemase [Candidatus Nealsonbacteria bacterium CG08_land_8_20_14_0_20_36_22]